MIGLVTTISVGGMNPDKMKMLNTLNDNVTEKTCTIVKEASKLSQSLEDCQCKIKSLRKDLQAKSKLFFEAETANKKLQKELNDMKLSFTKVEEELNTSKKSFKELFGDDDEFGDPSMTSTPHSKKLKQDHLEDKPEQDNPEDELEQV